MKHAQREQVEKKRIHDDFNIATGLFRSNKSVFAIGAVGGRSTPDAETSSKAEVKSEDDHALTAITHGPTIEKNLFSDKPMQKRILRKVERNYQYDKIFATKTILVKY